MSTPPRIQREHQGFNEYNPLNLNKKRSKTRGRMPNIPRDPRFIGINRFGLQVPSSNSRNYEPGLEETVELINPITGINIITQSRMNRNAAVAKYQRNRATAKAARNQRGAGWWNSLFGKKPEEEVKEEGVMTVLEATVPPPVVGGKRKTRRRYSKRKMTHRRR
jgi:hypothetical protein